jgi:hypothetical protein
MEENALLARLETRWHEAFLRFTETGEADAEFLAFMDSDPECQRAVEAAFNEQALAFEKLSRSLRDDRVTPPAEAVSEALTASVTQVLERALDLPPEQRNQVVVDAATALNRDVPPRRQQELKRFVEALGSRLQASWPG